MNSPLKPAENQALQQQQWIGASVPRPNGRRLVEGAAIYIDDIQLPRMANIFFLRSPYASARITKIDYHAALSSKGVIGSDSCALCRYESNASALLSCRSSILAG